MKTIGNYDLLEPIGAGGMGEVWRARHQRLGREAAVKLIRPEALEGSAEQVRTAIRRFEKEARAAAMLRSPHSIQIFDFGVTEEGTFFQAMELLDGMDLQVLVERHGPQDPARVVALLRQAADALTEAHEAGFVHRDIKPSNLLLCRMGTRHDFLKVLDFGLVKSVAALRPKDTLLTQVGTVPGSPAYLSPEALRGRPLDGRADVYALGCVAWWLLAGRLVFDAPTSIDLIVGHLERTPPPLDEVTPQPVPPGLTALVTACLAKDPALRPTIQALSAALAALDLERAWTEERAAAWWLAVPSIRPRPPISLPDSSQDAVATPLLPETARPQPQGLATELALADPLTTRERADLGGEDLPARRVRACDALKIHFEESRIDVLEFERRTAVALKAAGDADLRAALDGLPEPAPAPLAAIPPVQSVEAVPVAASSAALPAPLPEAWSDLVCVLSGVNRKGAWRPMQRTRVISVLGGAELDFRQAVLGPGLTEVRCVSFLGGAKIIVPPDLYVEMDGWGFLGGYSGGGSRAEPPTGDEPWIRISGFAVLGGVEVVVRSRPGARNLPAALETVAEVMGEVGGEIAARIEEAADRARDRATRREQRRQRRWQRHGGPDGTGS